jgi:Fe2+ transport system protein FeoA
VAPIQAALQGCWNREIFGGSLLATESQVPYLTGVKQPEQPTQPGDGDECCPQPFLCPLSHVNTGVAVRIKQLSASPEVTHRLREMGFCEEQKIKLLSRRTNLICQVCNARLGISTRLADKILVEPLVRQKVA